MQTQRCCLLPYKFYILADSSAVFLFLLFSTGVSFSVQVNNSLLNEKRAPAGVLKQMTTACEMLYDGVFWVFRKD